MCIKLNNEGLYVAQRISTPVKYYNHLSYDDLKTVLEGHGRIGYTGIKSFRGKLNE